jgi:AbrB family looped-hinge helix DNA binding protein
MKSRVGERGQVTIPKQFREELGIRPGDAVEFDLGENGELHLHRVIPRDPVYRILGILERFDVDTYLEETRGPAFDPRLDPPGPLDAGEK